MTTNPPSVLPSPPRTMNTQVVAWVILGAAFAVFCVMCLVTSLGVQYFFFRSTVPLGVQMDVARGSVGLVSTNLTESFERYQRFLSRGDTVLTDGQSQAVVTFLDRDGRHVGAVTLQNDSSIVLRRATVPRFSWSSQPQQVTLIALEGELDIFIPDDLPRETVMSVQLQNGTVIDISDNGHYQLLVTETDMRLETREGQAAILPANRDISRSVVTGQTGFYTYGADAIQVNPGYGDLLTDSFFASAPVEGFGTNAQTVVPVMEAWNCSDRTLNEPAGRVTPVVFQGRQAVRLLRGNGATTHGETACIQPFGPSAQVGRSVREYDHLEIRTTFYIDHHSLDLCGIEGSECPLMLLMDYIDEEGRSRQWFHGFYAKLESQADYPLSCTSCQQEHDRVNADVWYTFESGNLFTLLLERRPASILNIRFYASGHEYDVYVSELSMLVSPAPVAASPG